MEAILWELSHTLPEHFEDENHHGLTTRLLDILSPVLANISVRLFHSSAGRTQLPSLKVSRDSSEWGSTQHLTAPRQTSFGVGKPTLEETNALAPTHLHVLWSRPAHFFSYRSYPAVIEHFLPIFKVTHAQTIKLKDVSQKLLSTIR